jgi:hypothetical protein
MGLPLRLRLKSMFFAGFLQVVVGMGLPSGALP